MIGLGEGAKILLIKRGNNFEQDSFLLLPVSFQLTYKHDFKIRNQD